MKHKTLLFILSLLFALTAVVAVAGCGEEKKEVAHRHTWGDWINVEGQEPTCTKPGKRYRVCKVCGESDDISDAPALSHDWDKGERTKEPTCDTPGTFTYTCSRCGNVKTRDIEALGHIWKEVGYDKVATCNDDGLMRYKCEREGCGIEKREEVKALGHDMTSWAYTTDAPTCTKGGVQERHCSRGDLDPEYKDVPPLGHEWTAWNYSAQPTCTAAGHRSRECTRDGCTAKVEENVGALGHNWGDWQVTTPATCTAKGSQTHTCQEPGCDAKATEDILPLGHLWDIKIETQPTETESGKLTATCSLCKETQENDLAPLKDCTVYRVSVTGLNGRAIPGKNPTNVYIYDSNHKLVAGGPVVSQKQQLVDGTPTTVEYAPYFEAYLPKDQDYTVGISNLPYGFDHKDSYTLTHNTFKVIDPEGKESNDTRYSAESDSLQFKKVKLSASLTITLQGHILDGRLPDLSIQNYNYGYGGIIRGACMPNFSVTDIKGEDWTLQELMKDKEAVVFLVFSLQSETCLNMARELVNFANCFQDKISVVILDQDDQFTEDIVGVFEEPYNFPDWFHVVRDIETKFYMNLTHFNQDPGYAEFFVIGQDFSVADTFGYSNGTCFQRIFMNLKDGMYNKLEDTDYEPLPPLEEEGEQGSEGGEQGGQSGEEGGQSGEQGGQSGEQGGQSGEQGSQSGGETEGTNFLPAVSEQKGLFE